MVNRVYMFPVSLGNAPLFPEVLESTSFSSLKDGRVVSMSPHLPTHKTSKHSILLYQSIGCLKW